MMSGKKRSAPRRGFTLIEVMIAAVVSSFILVAVLSAFLMISRTSFTSGNYSQIEAETRRALEIFGVDARLASDIHWNSSQSVTLTIPTDSEATTLVTYAYDGATEGPTAGCFYRLVEHDPANPPRVLLRNVAPDFAFQRFRLEPPGGGSNEATDDAQTKQLRVTMRASVRQATTAAAAQTTLSAAYILRNKRVTN
jgi:prepilin-type N-terminal cleavage/methylation domain-containing protein